MTPEEYANCCASGGKEWLWLRDMFRECETAAFNAGLEAALDELKKLDDDNLDHDPGMMLDHCIKVVRARLYQKEDKEGK